MARVFISYSSLDRGWVEQLAADLRTNSVEVWFDVWEMLPGDSLTQKIGAAILDNDYFVVVLSPHSVSSEWVQRELGVALNKEFRERNVLVIPALLEDCSIPTFLQDKVYADFRKDYQQGLSELLKSVDKPKAIEEVDTSVPKGSSHRVIWENVIGENISSTNMIYDNVAE